MSADLWPGQTDTFAEEMAAAASPPKPPRRPTLEDRDQAYAKASQDPESDWYVPPGATVLQTVHDFLGRFVAYPCEAAHVAHTLWIAHTWFMDSWESTPRIAFLSPEPGSGKSRALELTEPLVPNPVHAVNTTPAYLFRKVSDEAGLPTILYDEIDTVFGPKAKDNEDIRGMLNAGHRRGAVAGRCIVKGKTVATEDLPAYCAVAMAGLNDLPDTIFSRSVIIRMRRRAPNEKVEPWRHRVNAPEAAPIAKQLALWAETSEIKWPEFPDGIEDRNADVWEALLAVADLAGDDWPKRARVAAVTHVTDSKAATPSLGVWLLADLRKVFGDSDVMGTEAILKELHNIEEAPWNDLRGKQLDARGLANRLRKYEITRSDVRIGEWHGKGYKREDLWDAWTRYLPTATAPHDVTSRINTEDEVIEKEAVPNQVADVELPGYGSVTSVIGGTNGTETDEKFDTCRTCSADLWAPESQQLGYCAKCREGDAA